MVRRSICKCVTCEHQRAFACRAILATKGRVQLPAEKRTGRGKQYTAIHERIALLGAQRQEMEQGSTRR